MKENSAILELKKRYRNCNFNIKEPVLDIGGGDATFLKSQGIKKATILEGGQYKEAGYKYIKADLCKKLPKLNKKFKTIFITEVLEHLENPLYLLAQVYDILDEDGICYISMPYTKIGNNHHHVSRWKLKGLKDQLSKLGFAFRVIEKRRKFKGIGFFLPHCWLVLGLKKRSIGPNKRNIQDYKLKL